MISARTFLVWASALAPLGAVAGDLTLSIDGFFQATGGSLNNVSAPIRFTTFYQAPNVNQVTHLITAPFTPVSSSDSSWVAASYEGVNMATGEVFEVGSVLLNLPDEGAPSSGAVSSIVAVIPRPGNWGTTIPATGLLAALNGGVVHTSETITVNLTKDSQNITGTIPYQVVDQDTLQFSEFSLQAGATTYNFAGTTLVRDGLRFYGELVRTDAGADFASVIFKVEVSDNGDEDGDGIPDLSDSDSGSNVWYAPYTVDAGNADKITSNVFGGFWFYPGFSDWIYHENHGVWYIEGDRQNLWIYDFALGWLWTSPDFYPYLFSSTYDTYIWYQSPSGLTQPDGKRWIYRYDTNVWEQVSGS